LELTREGWLTIKGDCIIGVSADKACSDLKMSTKRAIKRDDAKVRFILKVGDADFTFEARGHSRLKLTDKTSVVIRKSDYICPRTLAIKSNASASDVPRDVVNLLKKGREGKLIIEVSSHF
jgi:hypothetical protein